MVVPALAFSTKRSIQIAIFLIFIVIIAVFNCIEAVRPIRISSTNSDWTETQTKNYCQTKKKHYQSSVISVQSESWTEFVLSSICYPIVQWMNRLTSEPSFEANIRNCFHTALHINAIYKKLLAYHLLSRARMVRHIEKPIYINIVSAGGHSRLLLYAFCVCWSISLLLYVIMHVV